MKVAALASLAAVLTMISNSFVLASPNPLHLLRRGYGCGLGGSNSDGCNYQVSKLKVHPANLRISSAIKDELTNGPIWRKVHEIGVGEMWRCAHLSSPWNLWRFLELVSIFCLVALFY